MKTTADTSRNRPTRVARPGVRTAFTLVEMLLVLSVLLILAGISWVILSPQYEQHGLKDATEKVRTYLANTRNLAVEYGVTYQFRYEPNGGRFIVVPYEVDAASTADSQSSGAEAAAAGQKYRMISMQLPKGYTFIKPQATTTAEALEQVIPVAPELLQGFSQAQELQGVGWSNPILFLPDGTATAGSIRVKDEKNRYMDLTVRELTAAVYVGKVTQGSDR